MSDGGEPGGEEPRRSRALYDPETGKLDAKKLAAWITAAVAVVGALSAVSTKVGGWAKWWLDIDGLESRVGTCETRYEELNGIVRPATPRRDANARLDEALPSISDELRDARKERQTHEQALMRLSTIHEFGLRGAQEREAARESRQTIQQRERRGLAAGGDAADPLESLEGL